MINIDTLHDVTIIIEQIHGLIEYVDSNECKCAEDGHDRGSVRDSLCKSDDGEKNSGFSQ